jgi:hypothetical protein
MKLVNEQLFAFIGEPVLEAMQRVIAHMFYLWGKVIDTSDVAIIIPLPSQGRGWNNVRTITESNFG